MGNYEIIDEEEIYEEDFEGWLADYQHEEIMLREED